MESSKQCDSGTHPEGVGGGAGLAGQGHWGGRGLGLGPPPRPMEAASQAGSWLLSEAHQSLLDVKNPRHQQLGEAVHSITRLSPATSGAPAGQGVARSKASVSSRARDHSQPGAGPGVGQGWESLLLLRQPPGCIPPETLKEPACVP